MVAWSITRLYGVPSYSKLPMKERKNSSLRFEIRLEFSARDLWLIGDDCAW